MADEHHEDHGNTLSAWFLTLSWSAAWSVSGVFIILGGDLIQWTIVGVVLSVACAGIAGALKMAGFGRREPRPAPLTPEEWSAQQNAVAGDGDDAKGGSDGDTGKEPETVSAG
ncbi:hypothetical protein F4561_001839 [Lipingzhangella halophila]|uniref:Uncharacterized protein n=1 Tax=Lipingzhangella halophila TaxID=1783352 RepID=A0A7W7W2Q0_9ACTN|nr:HGxxPAAW family protein [Lipingzhangella halophila]MBB4931019.1 hypothetical protein [Lipingzhangella halophila]